MKLRTIIAILLSVVLLASALTGCGIFSIGGDSNTVTEAPQQPGRENASNVPAEGSCYGYQSLQSDFERDFYQKFGEAVMKDAPEPFTVDYSEDTERLVSIAEMYCYDHPEVFWVDDKEVISYLTDGATSLEVTVGFKMTGAELQKAKEALERAVQAALAAMPENAGDFEKEKYINDYLVDTVTYDNAAAASQEIAIGFEHTPYGALVEKKAVCDGYSTAFMLLAKRVGLDSSIVFGVSAQSDSANEYHAWNCVKIEGEWYYLDITWNEGSDEKIPAIGRYLNFNLTTEQALRDRTLLPMQGENGQNTESHLNNYFIPECTATKYYYFEYNCDTLTSTGDYSVLEDGIAAAAQNKEEYYWFRVDTSLDFEETYDTLMNGDLASVMRNVNKSGIGTRLDVNTYVYSEPVNRLVIIELKYQ